MAASNSDDDEMGSGGYADLAVAPGKFRIGRPHYDYTYTKVADGLFKCRRACDDGKRVSSAKCCRASDDGKRVSSELRLHLYRASDGYCIAADAPEDTSSIEVVAAIGVPIFRSQEHVLKPARHTWETNYKAHEGTDVEWRATGLSCETTLL